MDRHAANALRTLGIILTAILVIGAGAVLLLISLCAGIIASGSQNSQTTSLAIGCLVGAVALLGIGIVIITKLSRSMVHPTPPPPRPAGSQVAPPAPLPEIPDVPDVPVDPAHLSPASRSAIHNLVLAIYALLALDVLSSVVPALQPTSFRYPGVQIFPYSLIYRLLALGPYIVLLVGLRRSLGPRTFAYALAVPGMPAIWGLLSLPILLFSAQQMHGSSIPRAFVLLLPLAMDVLILYYAWTAITLTGIHPPPKRLIIASVVMFCYHLFFNAIATALIAMFTRATQN